MSKVLAYNGGNISLFVVRFTLESGKLDKEKQNLELEDEALKKLEESYLNLDVKIKCKDQMYKSQQEKLDELADQLELKAHLYKKLENQTSQLSDEVEEKETACLTLRIKHRGSSPQLAAFLPAFQTIPYNDIVLDLAYSSIDFPSIENQMKKDKRVLLIGFWLNLCNQNDLRSCRCCSIEREYSGLLWKYVN
ncbi:hypothetical protein L1887_39514 [Cichorium endivia]|nr:hypothetical protein L1887_39514 [Cichorium endivia]